MLPNTLRSGVYSLLQGTVNDRHLVGLKVRCNVAVDVERDGDGTMTQALLHDLGMDVVRPHDRGVAVARGVKPNALQARPPYLAYACMREAAGL